MRCSPPQRSEWGSWVINNVVDLAASHGIPRDQCVWCQWVLTFKKLTLEDLHKKDTEKLNEEKRFAAASSDKQNPG